ncbi:FG-GAP-like repeat-containing protein [Streptomyces sp. NPDC048330]|uniref:FG-GAP-like repeat-containing protein n=1 Tax=Streptomyces sp. NPDC048330 TaxID=3365533 RepID=UPI00371E9294
MLSVRSTQRRLGASVATVLAVTLGAGALTVPAASAAVLPAAGASTTGTTQQAAVAFPGGAAVIIASGTTGFLSYDKTVPEYRWTPYDGGAPTVMPGVPATTGTGSGDLVVSVESDKMSLRDMGTNSTLHSVWLGTLDGPGGEGSVTVAYGGAAGSALFTTVKREAGLSLVQHVQGKSPVTVTGLPTGLKSVRVHPGTAEHALVTYVTAAGARHRAVLDLATGAVTETYETPASAYYGDVAVSATSIAWVEYDTNAHTARVVVRARGGSATDTIVPLGETWMLGAIEIGLVGDRLTVSQRGGLDSTAPDPLHALTAHSLTGGAAVPLLDHVTSAVATADGGQLVRGGRIDGGEGLYRITPGEDGTPVATLVASTGKPTGLVFTKPADVPATVELDKYRGNVTFKWHLNRGNADYRVTLRHVRTGKSITVSRPQIGTDLVAHLDWRGDLFSEAGPVPDLSAYNGAYTWEITSKPLNGIGTPITDQGTFTVVRKANPHDFDDNGSPDLLSRDTGGVLWRDSTFDSPYTREITSQRSRVGAGWNVYDRIEAAGDIAGSTVGDLVARDKAGVLWLYQGDGRGSFTTRTRIGGGWQVFDQIAAGSDVTGDGRPDLVATDKAGVMWLYKGTGKANAPYTGRTRVGAGWNVYDHLTATGDLYGVDAPAGDLVARDKAGVLWLYEGDGRGSFRTRIRISAGWNSFSDIVGSGDVNRDGIPDLVARDAVNHHAYAYLGTHIKNRPLDNPRLTELEANKAYNLFS